MGLQTYWYLCWYGQAEFAGMLPFPVSMWPLPTDIFVFHCREGRQCRLPTCADLAFLWMSHSAACTIGELLPPTFCLCYLLFCINSMWVIVALSSPVPQFVQTCCHYAWQHERLGRNAQAAVKNTSLGQPGKTSFPVSKILFFFSKRKKIKGTY